MPATTVAKLVDTSLCIGCKACEVACQEWNDQEFTLGVFNNTYQTQPDLTPSFWNLIKFNEHVDDGVTRWRNLDALSAATAGQTVTLSCTGSHTLLASNELDRAGAAKPTCTVTQLP